MILGTRPKDPVGSLVVGPVAVISPTATLRQAAQTLATDHLGLLVTRKGVVFGVVSQRDLAAAMLEEFAASG